MSNPWGFLLRAGCAAFTLALLTGTAAAQSAAPAIVIGRSLPLSGQLKAVGELKRDGGDAFVHKLNAAGGIGGRKIELVTLDDGYVPDTTIANLRKIATENNPVAFVSLLRLPADGDAVPLLEELKIPAVGVASATHLLRARLNKYGFPVRASMMDEGRKLAKHIRAAGIERVAVIYQDVPLGLTTRASMEAGLKEVGLAANTFKLDAVAAEIPAVARMVVEGKPQAVFLGALTPAAAGLIGELRKLSFAGTLYTFSSTDVMVLNKLVGDKAMGLTISQIVPIPHGPRVKIVGEYVQAVKDLGRGTPTILGLEGYIEAKVLAEGLRRAGRNATPETLVKALETMRDTDVGGFFVDYTPKAHTGSLFVEVDMVGSGGRLIR